MARNLEDIMRVISALVAKADSSATTPEEAASFRAKAEEFMRKYRVEEESLIAQDEFSILPIFQVIEVCQIDSPFRQFHSNLWGDVARHCGLRYAFRYNGKSGYAAHAVGYESDLRYAEFLFQSARLVMIAKLEPNVNSEESDKDNIYRLRSGGIDRQRIAEMVWGKRGHQEGLKVGRLYKEACAERGEEAAVSGRNVNAAIYRIAYAGEFVDRFRMRLFEARSAADSTGGAMALHGRAERVQEAFYIKFPEYRPQPEKEAVQTTTAKPKGRALKSWTVADEARYQRFNNSPAAVRAKDAGARAAESVQIDRVARAKRVESTPEDNGTALEGR